MSTSATADETRAGTGEGQPDEMDGQDVAASEAATAEDNPRKRKKSSRACDYCHVNHQPCDNAKPRCSYCQKHNKQCLYLRPQKKRGPAQGYRNALHSMRESAAAWGAALILIPELSAKVEAALSQSDEGKRLARAIKDPQQQDHYIQAWQQSGAFRAFFCDDAAVSEEGGNEPRSNRPESSSRARPRGPSITSTDRPPKAKAEPTGSQSSILTPSPSQDGSKGVTQDASTRNDVPRHPSLSVSDLVAKDAARSSEGFSQTLGSLGFAPGETLEDFVAMSSNPEPIEEGPLDFDPSLGSELDQKAYYELLMGKSFFP